MASIKEMSEKLLEMFSRKHKTAASKGDAEPPEPTQDDDDDDDDDEGDD